jgi:hypothetical protein
VLNFGSIMIRRIKLFICIFIFALCGVAAAFSGGPVPGRTGAPDEPTCVDCHDSFELNRGSGRVDILGLPKIYTPGQRISIQVSVRQQRQKRWGFQITALDAAKRAVGQFSISDSSKTQIIMGDARSYVEHNLQGSQSTASDSMQWTFDWIAPETDAGPVTFYAAGNAANGDGSPLGDFIYTTAAQIGGPTDPVVTLTTPNGGETLKGNETFKITWSSTNATSHDILFQLNGTGDVPRTIVAGLSGSVSEFNWNVPNDFATTRGRIIIVAQGQSGRSDSDVSDRDFTITASQIKPGPSITSIEVTDKKIKTIGSGFGDGATLAVNEIGFSSPAKVKSGGTKMIQKGAAANGSTIGQLIPPGARVRLRFINPDGGITEIDFVRPSAVLSPE